MPKEDYLLKYLEKLSRVIAAMLGLREKGFPEDALKLAEKTFNELLSIDLDAISNMRDDDFIELIKKESFQSTYIDALAKISYETSKCYVAKGETLKMRLFAEKALLLYLFLNEKDKTFSFERENIISELKELTNKN